MEATKPGVQQLLAAFMMLRRVPLLQNPIAGLRGTDMRILHTIAHRVGAEGTGIRVSELGGLLNVSNPTVTQQVNELERRGIVEKQPDASDRRAVLVTLSPKGIEAMRAAGAALMAEFAGLVDYLGEEDSAELARLLGRTLQYFQETRDDG